MEQTTFDYQLIDDNGISTAEAICFLLPIGTVFVHEYGTYKVIEYFDRNGLKEIFCEQLSKQSF
jgi:hypothetical protein